MNKLILFILAIINVCCATTVVRSIAVYATTNSSQGHSINTVVTANGICLAHKPAICTSTAPVAMLGRLTVNISTNTLNDTVPVINAVNNVTICYNFADCFVSKWKGYFLRSPFLDLTRTNYWTGSDALGKYVGEAESCGGNWTVNTTANIGYTNTRTSAWLNGGSAACYLSKPFLCKCESYATPITPDGDHGNYMVGVWVGVGVTIGVVVLLILTYGGIWSYKNLSGKREN
jgi:hypothetical protein